MRKRRVRIDPRVVHPIVAEGAIATGLAAGGRMVPVLIIDLGDRPEVRELIRLHHHFPAGDCVSNWGVLDSDVAVFLKFQRPIETKVIVKFELPKFASIADQVLNARAVYLQHGVAGETLSSTYTRDRVLVELPPAGFQRKWEEVYRATMTAEIRRMHGLPAREARLAAVAMIKQLRTFGSFTMPPNRTAPEVPMTDPRL